jgi:hypothetical protein
MSLFKGKFLPYFFFFSLVANVVLVGVFGKKAYNKYAESKEIPTSVVEQNKWFGYDIVEFNFKGVNAKIVVPENANEGKHWIWRTQFWGEEPQVDIALLEKGFHLAFVEVKNLYGSKTAVDRLDGFYDFVVKNFHLNKKVVLEGLSRGGLDAFNWASLNTDKVFCIYADAPVIDLKSWPLGLGKGTGSPEDVASCLEAYQLTEDELRDLKETPLYTCIKLAEARIPLIHVCGDKDEVVPFEENTFLLAEKYEAAGGEIKIIIKKGGSHHPHSLEDPKPIVDFILEKTIGNQILATALSSN